MTDLEKENEGPTSTPVEKKEKPQSFFSRYPKHIALFTFILFAIIIAAATLIVGHKSQTQHSNTQQHSGNILFDTAGGSPLAPTSALNSGPLVPIYRLANYHNSYPYFYTASNVEVDSAEKNGYTLQGIGFYAFETRGNDSSLAPVYRLYNPSVENYLYTTSTSERDSALSAGAYQNQGIVFYAYTSAFNSASPIYRLFSNGHGYFYTTSSTERDYATNTNWTDQGIAFWAFTSPVLNPIPVCTGLAVDRDPNGAAPFTITFTASGNSGFGSTPRTNPINQVIFSFGDGSIQNVTSGGGIGGDKVSVSASHTYNNPGTYQVTATLSDTSGAISADSANCTQMVTVSQSLTTPTPTPVSVTCNTNADCAAGQTCQQNTGKGGICSSACGGNALPPKPACPSGYVCTSSNGAPVGDVGGNCTPAQSIKNGAGIPQIKQAN